MSTQSDSSTPNPPIRKLEKFMIPLATDERCWFKCRQTNGGRIRAQDPRCSMFCYYSNKIPTMPIKPPIEPSSSSTAGLPASAHPASTPVHPNQTDFTPQAQTSSEVDKRSMLIERYTIPALKGKFLYFAIGRPAVARHLASMRRVHSVEHDWIYEKLKEHDEEQSEWEHVPKRPLEQTNRGLMVLAYHRDYERTVNISYSLASVVASIHLHFERLYAPSYKILSKLPQSLISLTDPERTTPTSQFTLLHQLFNKPLLSDSMNLLSRAAESLVEVTSRLAARYASTLPGDEKTPRRPGPPSGHPNTPSS